MLGITSKPVGMTLVGIGGILILVAIYLWINWFKEWLMNKKQKPQQDSSKAPYWLLASCKRVQIEVLETKCLITVTQNAYW